MSEYPKVAEGIDINQVEDGYVIYQSEKDKVHYLNKTAVLVLEACTGKNTKADITAIVKDAYGLDQDPEKEVSDCLSTLIEEGLVK